MTEHVGVLQNDPNSGLRGRLEPEPTSAATVQVSDGDVFIDLQEEIRDRLAAPQVEGRGRRTKRRR
jgi:hypothetical protein